MISKTRRSFWTCFDKLPQEIQLLAREKFRLWQIEPFHPSLHFKEINTDLWSVRINARYRALARRRQELIVWFWIGTHEEYNGLVK